MKMRLSYTESVHRYGVIWNIAALLIFLMIPVSICIYFGIWPEAKYVFKGLGPVALIFYPSSLLEVVTYTPLLGAAGTYLSFVTGNITNLKLPCGLNAMENAGVRANSEEGQVISTIAIATSSIVTTVVIAVGVLVFTPVLPYITAEGSPLAPAFRQVVPALFGALGMSYFTKNIKISIIPVFFSILILIFIGSLKVGALIPICMAVSLLSTHILYKKGIVK
ncbi:MAG: hypothetical protein ACTTK5_01615 [Candidatus Fimenecus sp.]